MTVDIKFRGVNKWNVGHRRFRTEKLKGKLSEERGAFVTQVQI